jgi:hypothetical protein
VNPDAWRVTQSSEQQLTGSGSTPQQLNEARQIQSDACVDCRDDRAAAHLRVLVSLSPAPQSGLLSGQQLRFALTPEVSPGIYGAPVHYSGLPHQPADVWSGTYSLCGSRGSLGLLWASSGLAVVLARGSGEIRCYRRVESGGRFGECVPLAEGDASALRHCIDGAFHLFDLRSG